MINFDRCSCAGMAAVLSLCGLALGPSSASAQTCTQTLSPGANVASAVSGAAAGSTICLSSGSYGNISLSAVVKNPRVTVRSAIGQGASVGLAITQGSNGLTFDSLIITGSNIGGATTKNIIIQNSQFTGPATFDDLANSNVLFTNNTHNNINGGGQFASPARLHLRYGGTIHSGVTIQNSVMDGGSADGVQAGVGVNIINNVFRNISDVGCADCHTDGIQLLTAPDSVVRGNYFVNTETGIVAYDKLVRATIENNVLDLRQSGSSGRPWAIEIYSDTNSVIRHNTLLYQATCTFNLPCGIISITRKTQDPAGVGTIVVDNIATRIDIDSGSTVAERRQNLLRQNAAASDISGVPIFKGGVIPTTFAGYELAENSPGKGRAAAPSGADIGAINSSSSSSTVLPPPTDLRVIP